MFILALLIAFLLFWVALAALALFIHLLPLIIVVWVVVWFFKKCSK